MKIHEYNEMMSYLTRPAQPKNIKVADLVDDLTPGPLKDELTKDYDPSQETHEQYLQRKALEDDRARLAIGGGAFVGKDLPNNREGFDAPRRIKVDDNALVTEWRNSLTKKNPVPWITFLKNKFDEKTANAIKARVNKDKTIDLKPAEEFEVVRSGKKEKRLKLIEKLVEEHNKSDSILYKQEDIFKKVGAVRLTNKENPEEMALINSMDKPEDKVRKAFDKITNENMKLYDPKSKSTIKVSNIIYQMISDIASQKGGSRRFQIDKRFIDKALSTHEPYLKIKDDFDYFALEARPFIGKNFQDAFERAKFIRGGLDIKNLQEFKGGYAKPEDNILSFAIRHAYLNNKNNRPSQVEFFKLKKDGTKGRPLSFDELPRDRKTAARVLNVNNVGFEYKGKFFTKKNLKRDGRDSGLFDEVYDMSKKGQTLVPNPNDPDGPKITLRKLLQDTNDKLSIGHNDAKGGVAGSPFNDLRLEGSKFNVAMFNAYDKVKNPAARKLIINNLQGKFGNLKGQEYETAFINAKSKLAKDLFKSPRQVIDLPTYYRAAGQKVLADTGKSFFSQPEPFKKEIARVAGIDLEEYEANKSSFKKNLVSQLARNKNLSPKKVEEDLTNVQKVIRKMQGQMNSGMDPKLLVEYLGAEMKDLAAFGQKYGGSALAKAGKGITGIDLPIFQTMFGAMYDIEQDSPLWLTLPAAFTDEVANIFNLYNKSEGKFGLGKVKDFGKFVASSFVPQVVRSPIFKAVSKVGKIGSLAAPLTEAGVQAYRFEKMKERRDDAIRKFNLPIEIGNRAFDNYIRSTIPQDAFDELNVPASPGLPGLKRDIQQLGSIFGLADDPYAIQKVRGDVTGTGLTSPMALQRLYDRQGLVKGGPPDPTKRTFLKLLGLIPAGIAGLASLRFGPQKVAKVAKTLKGAPEWFGALVDKVIQKGTDMTKSLGFKDRQEVYGTKIGDDEMVIVYKDLDTGNIKVEYQSPENMGESAIDLNYKAPEQLEDGTIVPAEFNAVELEPRGIRMGPDDYDIEFDGENVVESVDELMSDTTKLKQFATDKVDPKDLDIRTEKLKKVRDLNEDQVSQAEYLETKYGSAEEGSPYYQDFSDYD